MKILALSHDCDLILYQMLRFLNREPGIEITVAGSEGDRAKVPEELPFVVISPIKSKFSFRAICDLRNVLKQGHYDIVFAISTSALSTALFASISLPVKVVGYRGTQARVRRFDPTYYMALLNPRVSHIVCETLDIEQYLSQYIPSHKLSTKTKPYDTAWVNDALKTPKKYDPGYLQLVYIGISKGRPHKGLKYLLDAMRLLKDLPVHLTVIGEADPEDEAAAPETVTFCGNRGDAVHYLPGADIFVLPSTRDASPRVLREAQACGVPCIVSDIPGARDLIIDGQSGLLVPPADPEALAEAVRRLAGDAELRKEMGENGMEHISLRFRPEDYVAYFKTTFTNLMQQ